MTEDLDRGEVFASDGWGSESNEYLNPNDGDQDYEDEWYDSDEYWEEFDEYGDEDDEPYDGYLYDD